MLENAVYRGHVIHTRNLPRKHVFRYPLTMMLVDIDNIENWIQPSRFTSVERFNLASFHYTDYMGKPTCSKELKLNIAKKIKDESDTHFEGKIFLLTQIRRLGYVFNPVSFYLCYRCDGELSFIISEIENTPWGERYSYLHVIDSQTSHTLQFKKKFHVSPFLPMELIYKWNFSFSSKTLSISMDCISKSNEHTFNASLMLEKMGTSARSLDKTALTSLFLTLKIPAYIYWQALKLWIKKVPFYSHPNPQKRKGW